MVNSHFALAPVDNCNICIPIKYDSFAFDLGEAAKTIKWHYTVGQARYKPFGERRSEWNAYFTDRKFTGYAREDALGGIDFAQARFYDSLVGRFLSPDTLVPKMDIIVNDLGGIKAFDQKPPDIKNHEFRPQLSDGSHIDWPNSLSITPIREVSGVWNVVSVPSIIPGFSIPWWRNYDPASTP